MSSSTERDGSKMRDTRAPAAKGRRKALKWLASGIAAAALPAAPAFAQGFPDHPIRLYVGYPPGGGTDFVARTVARQMTQVLGQQVVVMNMPGATGAIALEHVAHASPADGYTLLVISAADTILPALRAHLPFDIDRDLVPIAPAANGALALVVTPLLPAKDVKELVALAKASPGKLNFGSPGVGNSQHLAGEFFNQLAHVDIVHVPFKGGAEALSATASGDIQMTFASIAPAMALVDGGKLRLLGVSTAKRSASLPSVPTIAEAGVPGYDRSTWFGIAAPAGVPKDIVLQLNAAIGKAMMLPETQAILVKEGLDAQASPQDSYAAFVHNELVASAKIVRQLGIKQE
jgi:tripartite-type tricarboxylate transporter receptor subunit TctC